MKEERFKEWKPPKMEDCKPTEWHWIPFHSKNIKIGKYVDIGAGTLLFGHYGITIEDDVQIGGNCCIYSYDSERKIRGKIVIKKGVKIGALSVILPKKGEVHYITKNVKAGSVVY